MTNQKRRALNWPPEIEREIENEWNEMTKAALEAAIKDEIDQMILTWNQNGDQQK